MALTKNDIAHSIYTQLDIPKNRSVELVEFLLEILKKNLANGEDVVISRVGRFCVRDKRQRKGRNPETGEDMILKPRRVVRFRCSGVLRRKINGKG